MPIPDAHLGFTAGEVDPRMMGRVDLQYYNKACQIIENFIVLPSGAIVRRTGSRYEALAKYDDLPCALIPFEFSEDQGYTIECGDGYFRFFYGDGGRIADPAEFMPNAHFLSNISGWDDLCGVGCSTAWNAGLQALEMTSDGSNYAAAGASGVTSQAGFEHVLLVTVASGGGPMGVAVGSAAGDSGYLPEIEITSGQTQIRFTPLGSTAYVQLRHNASAAWSITDVEMHLGYYEISAPYSYGDVSTLMYAQTADKMYLCHKDHGPQVVTRHADTNWTISCFNHRNGPFDEPIALAHVWPSVTSGLGVLTGSGNYFSNADYWSNGWIQYFNDSNVLVQMFISGVITSNTASCAIYSAIANTNPGFSLYGPAWSVVNRYPVDVSFFQQRLIMAGNEDRPQTIYGSRTGQFDDFAQGADDTHGLDFIISSNRVNRIRWLEGQMRLFIGTLGGEFVAGGGLTAEVLTPANPYCTKHTNLGSRQIKPLYLGDGLFFVQRDGLKIAQMVYDINTEAFKSIEVTAISSHITGPGIIAGDVSQYPYPILWYVRSDGQICALTYDQNLKVAAWHRHVTTGEYEGITVISGGSRDNVWVVTKREFGGVVRRYIERFAAEPEVLEDSFYVDCGLTYEGHSAKTIYGLNHLAGMEVQILADGSVSPSQIVAANGTITLSREAEKVHAGLGYVSKVKPFRIEPPTREGIALGRPIRIAEIAVDLYRTVNMVLVVDNNEINIPFRDASDHMDTAIPWYTGVKTVVARGKWTTDSDYEIRQDQPLPMCIRAIVARASVGKG